MQSSTFKTPVPVTVTTTLTKIKEINLGGLFSSLAFEVSPVGAALDAFEVRVRLHPNGSFIPFMSGTEFDLATISMMKWSTLLGPHEVADGTVAAAIIN
ncbi:MAG: hypothetical protein JKX85_15875, partial [Phycisphaeraceae bacterium]|nr:hypothetical protein [Phycisphaeraceae bacterium]